MAVEATNENVNLLLTKLLTERYCRVQASDFEACVANYVPQKVDGSFVDLALQRRGLKKCDPYKEAAQKCLGDEKRHQMVMRAASLVPACKEERNAFAKCQRAHKSPEPCEKQAIEMLICGLVHLLQKSRQKGNATA